MICNDNIFLKVFQNRLRNILTKCQGIDDESKIRCIGKLNIELSFYFTF